MKRITKQQYENKGCFAGDHDDCVIHNGDVAYCKELDRIIVSCDSCGDYSLLKAQNIAAQIEKIVEIVVMGGCVQSVIKPRGVTLNIKDYDVDGDYDGTETDDNGDHYQLMLWDTDENVSI